ncbi:thiamine-monophosphate kinase [Piscirickettsia salmonis]|uniref:Thiamine-monophosphate kinase n=1 Tax=Piscirickettsia salmonis TaxID=1238 RepID=A0A9Q6LLX7_PISSA|nr:thiamine-phosphate kinase [Piscirickettsia salmonis]ALA25625.1 thiamine-monophosphate kinase [Piscirickettsia salmonis]APS43125.1 thiamine-monophosphate kinase [Piscirickettsia salmonis]APS46472.1 thiamine-monophosphate kinase [Piscirickettsia salmonis]APS50440.1 thiamine-monophosphate kinase [Piscirickettsia salmonis]APS53643.1 thiamine-monophosphate kinase [Piscirickettsia salmonis]
MSKNKQHLSSPLSEFDLIERFFKRSSSLQEGNNGIILGIGDDCALLQLGSSEVIAASIDSLVSGVHFFADEKPFNIGYKAVMVNASDLAAMGAKPRWLTLALTLPEMDENWLSLFSQGLFQALAETGMSLVGGDTTRGPLSLSVQVQGTVDKDKALRRSGMQEGDVIYVSGPLGGAALGLAHRLGNIQFNHDQKEKTLELIEQALCLPQARWQLGLILKDYANSCIDISDGLAADLTHMLRQSACGAKINLADIPYHLAFSSVNLSLNEKWQYALAGGEDYELCFSMNKNNEEKLLEKLKSKNINIFRIGEVISGDDKNLNFYLGRDEIKLNLSGYRHF